MSRDHGIESAPTVVLDRAESRMSGTSRRPSVDVDGRSDSPTTTRSRLASPATPNSANPTAGHFSAFIRRQRQNSAASTPTTTSSFTRRPNPSTPNLSAMRLEDDGAPERPSLLSGGSSSSSLSSRIKNWAPKIARKLTDPNSTKGRPRGVSVDLGALPDFDQPPQPPPRSQTSSFPPNRSPAHSVSSRSRVQTAEHMMIPKLLMRQASKPTQTDNVPKGPDLDLFVSSPLSFHAGLSLPQGSAPPYTPPSSHFELSAAEAASVSVPVEEQPSVASGSIDLRDSSSFQSRLSTSSTTSWTPNGTSSIAEEDLSEDTPRPPNKRLERRAADIPLPPSHHSTINGFPEQQAADFPLPDSRQSTMEATDSPILSPYSVPLSEDIPFFTPAEELPEPLESPSRRNDSVSTSTVMPSRRVVSASTSTITPSTHAFSIPLPDSHENSMASTPTASASHTPTTLQPSTPTARDFDMQLRDITQETSDASTPPAEPRRSLSSTPSIPVAGSRKGKEVLPQEVALPESRKPSMTQWPSSLSGYFIRLLLPDLHSKTGPRTPFHHFFLCFIPLRFHQHAHSPPHVSQS
ncbi:hypothetical protein BT69DRAFT_184721 [Atractiella rhizophila]|nr:hypothetical protein BT69DRAFT_184721 [Atractiella rhizophila]